MQLLCVLLLAWARGPAPKAVTDGPMADRSRPAALEKVGVQSQVSMHHAEKADGVATGVARSASADVMPALYTKITHQHHAHRPREKPPSSRGARVAENRSLLRASAADQPFGRWHYNLSAGYPYLLDDDDEWAPRCSALQRNYLKDLSAVPGWLRMQWTPPDGQRCARADLCDALSGKTLALIGDSIMMQMAHAMQGFFLPERRVNYWNSPYNLTICSGRASLLWLRSNAYNRRKSRKVLRDADVVIANWGLWDSAAASHTSDQKHHQNLEELLSDVETLLLPKLGTRFFWRATIAAHGWCDADVLEDVPLTKNPVWRAGELMARDRQVDQPMFRSRPGVSVLHIDRLHMPFGHRVHLGKSATRIMSDSADNGVHDCLHYCEPGVPDSWVELFCWHMRDSAQHD